MNFFKKIFVGCISLNYQLFYHFVNRFSQSSIDIDEGSPITISLTSYGKRIDRVYLTLESIAAQKGVKFRALTLWLSSEDITRTCLPSTILRLEKRGVSVKFVEDNIKSYKKIYYEYDLRRNEPGALIVTADDDVYYPSGWLSELYKRYVESHNSIICYRGHHITTEQNGVFSHYSEWLDIFDTEKQTISESKALMPTGVGGVLYPIESLIGLDTDIKYFSHLCPRADDIWLKLRCLKNGFSAKRVGFRNVHFPPVLSFEMKGLEVYNVLNGGNDVQFYKCLKHFDLKVSDFK